MCVCVCVCVCCIILSDYSVTSSSHQACVIVVHTYRKDYAGLGEYPLMFASLIALFFVFITGACE